MRKREAIADGDGAKKSLKDFTAKIRAKTVVY